MTTENQETKCSLCKGVTCVSLPNGRLINKNEQGNNWNFKKVIISGTKIEDCEMKQAHDWAELDGKIDETNLGC